jgi:hypothetical protein
LLDVGWIEVGSGPPGPATGEPQTKTVGHGGPDATLKSQFSTSRWYQAGVGAGTVSWANSSRFKGSPKA